MVDYSKWKDIEISDDEDDTHPNIDKHSLFKWRHEARVQRMADFNEKKKKLENEVKTAQKKLNVKTLELKSKPDDENLKKEIENLEVQLIKAQKEFESIEKEEKKMPWNVDTISLDSDFIKENEKKIKHLVMLDEAEDFRLYLIDEPQLICEETVNYLTRDCLLSEIHGKTEFMVFLANRVINFKYIFEMAKQLDCDPRSCFARFCMDPKIINYTQDPLSEKKYLEPHENALEAFCEPIKKLAKKKLDGRDFIKENEKKIEHFAKLSKAKDCRLYLIDETQLICEETVNELTVWCLYFEMKERYDLMIRVSEKVMTIQYITEMYRRHTTYPYYTCIDKFFALIQRDRNYMEDYEDKLEAFRKRIKDRAKEKIDKAMKEIEEERVLRI